MKLGPFKLKVYECYEHKMEIGNLARMQLFVGAPYLAEVTNRAKRPRMVGVVTVDEASFDRFNDVTSVRWNGKDFEAGEGKKLLKAGAPFEVTPKYAEYEWAYRGWPVPEHLKTAENGWLTPENAE